MSIGFSSTLGRTNWLVGLRNVLSTVGLEGVVAADSCCAVSGCTGAVFFTNSLAVFFSPNAGFAVSVTPVAMMVTVT